MYMNKSADRFDFILRFAINHTHINRIILIFTKMIDDPTFKHFSLIVQKIMLKITASVETA